MLETYNGNTAIFGNDFLSWCRCISKKINFFKNLFWL